MKYFALIPVIGVPRTLLDRLAESRGEWRAMLIRAILWIFAAVVCCALMFLFLYGEQEL